MASMVSPTRALAAHPWSDEAMLAEVRALAEPAFEAQGGVGRAPRLRPATIPGHDRKRRVEPRSCPRVSATAAGECIQRARRAGLSWPLPDELSDDALERSGAWTCRLHIWARVTPDQNPTL